VPAITWTVPCIEAAATSTRWRGSRSAQTPAATVIAAEDACRAAMTSPRAVAEEMCRTAKASATVVTPSPSAEMVVLEKTSRKLRSASALSLPCSSITGRLDVDSTAGDASGDAEAADRLGVRGRRLHRGFVRVAFEDPGTDPV